MASPTPGYCTLTATARSCAGRRVGEHGPVDLADRRRRDRRRVPLGEQLLGRPAELAVDRPRRPARRSSAARRPAAGRAPGGRARAGRRRGSWPSGRPSSARPSCCRGARRPARRCAAPARRRARPVARPRRTAGGPAPTRSVPPTPTPSRASSRLRPLRLGAPDRRRPRGRRRRTPAAAPTRDRAGHGRGDDRRASSGLTRPARAREWMAATAVGTNRSGTAMAASWRPSTRNAAAVGISSNSSIWRRTGTTWSCIVMTTEVGTSTSPSHSSARNPPSARPASSTIRQSWLAASCDRPRLPRARSCAGGTAATVSHRRSWPASGGRRRRGR